MGAARGRRERGVGLEPHERARRGARAASSGFASRGLPSRRDLLVNCTSVGLEGGGVERSATEGEALNQLGLTFDQVGEYSYVVDLVYRSRTPTPLLAAAGAHGARTLDGLEILVAQGALSFELWTGVRPPRETMLSAARE